MPWVLHHWIQLVLSNRYLIIWLSLLNVGPWLNTCISRNVLLRPIGFHLKLLYFLIAYHFRISWILLKGCSVYWPYLIQTWICKLILTLVIAALYNLLKVLNVVDLSVCIIMICLIWYKRSLIGFPIVGRVIVMISMRYGGICFIVSFLASGQLSLLLEIQVPIHMLWVIQTLII